MSWIVYVVSRCTLTYGYSNAQDYADLLLYASDTVWQLLDGTSNDSPSSTGEFSGDTMLRLNLILAVHCTCNFVEESATSTLKLYNFMTY